MMNPIILITKPYLNVSRIIVNKTNFPKSGTTNDVGGMISASKRKNTVRDSRIDIERLTYKVNTKNGNISFYSRDNFTLGVLLNSRLLYVAKLM